MKKVVKRIVCYFIIIVALLVYYIIHCCYHENVTVLKEFAIEENRLLSLGKIPDDLMYDRNAYSFVYKYDSYKLENLGDFDKDDTLYDSFISLMNQYKYVHGSFVSTYIEYSCYYDLVNYTCKGAEYIDELKEDEIFLDMFIELRGAEKSLSELNLTLARLCLFVFTVYYALKYYNHDTMDIL